MHFFSDCCTIPELSNSDHLGLMLTMRHRHVSQAPTPRGSVWRYNLANFELANDLLCDVDFDEILDFNDIQKSWMQFKAVFLHVMEQCIPKAVLPQMPWLTKEIIQLIKRRNYFFRKAHNNGNDNDFAKFRQLCNRVASILRLEKQKFFSELVPNNTKEFWKKISLLNSKECSIPTLSNGSTVAATCLEKANLFLPGASTIQFQS